MGYLVQIFPYLDKNPFVFVYHVKFSKQLTEIIITKRATLIVVPAINEPTRTNIAVVIIDNTDTGERETVTPTKMPKIKVSLKKSELIA